MKPNELQQNPVVFGGAPPFIIEETVNSQDLTHTLTGQSDPYSPLYPVMNQKSGGLTVSHNKPAYSSEATTNK